MDQFRIWKKYPRTMEGVLGQAGYGDAEFSVRREDDRGTACARWSWHCGAAELTHEEWPAGLELVWTSTEGWSYQGHGEEERVALPVPVFAAPDAIIALLPALMDGRRGQLLASEEEWKHAALIVHGAESASLYGDDKYDSAYQRAEEKAGEFSRWQDQLDGAQPDATPRYADGPLDELGRSGATHAEELARGTHVNVILDRGVKALDERMRHPDPELFGVLTDYFTRAVVFPGQFDPEDGHRHTSDPSRVLAHLLLQHLERHDLDLDDVLDMTHSPVAPVGEAMVDCIAQVLSGSRWFIFAAPGRSSTGRVVFRTVFGTEGVLQVSGVLEAADGDQAQA